MAHMVERASLLVAAMLSAQLIGPHSARAARSDVPQVPEVLRGANGSIDRTFVVSGDKPGGGPGSYRELAFHVAETTAGIGLPELVGPAAAQEPSPEPLPPAALPPGRVVLVTVFIVGLAVVVALWLIRRRRSRRAP